MKFFCNALVFFTLGYGALQANEVFFEAKASYFYPTSHTFREISDNGAGEYGLELTGQFCGNWYGWASADWFSASGDSIGLDNHTRTTLVPIALGVKYIHPISSSWRWYLGVGGQGEWVKTKNDSPYVNHITSNWAWGGIFKGGFMVNMGQSFFLDLFANYQLMTDIKTKTHPLGSGFVTGSSGNPSGFAAGVGLGYRFGCK